MPALPGFKALVPVPLHFRDSHSRPRPARGWSYGDPRSSVFPGTQRAERCDCQHRPKVPAFRETVRSWLPYFEGSGIPAPQEKEPSSPLDFRTPLPASANPANSTGKLRLYCHSPRVALLNEVMDPGSCSRNDLLLHR